MACDRAPPKVDPTYAHLRTREPPLYQMPHMWLVILQETAACRLVSILAVGLHIPTPNFISDSSLNPN